MYIVTVHDIKGDHTDVLKHKQNVRYEHQLSLVLNRYHIIVVCLCGSTFIKYSGSTPARIKKVNKYNKIIGKTPYYDIKAVTLLTFQFTT